MRCSGLLHASPATRRGLAGLALSVGLTTAACATAPNATDASRSDGGQTARDAQSDGPASRDEGGAGSSAEMTMMALLLPDAGPQGYEIVTMNLDGGNFTRITDNRLTDFCPHFSPDGTHLVYSRYATGSEGTPGATTDIVVYEFSSRTEVQLTHDGISNYPVWSPDGTQIAFLRSVTPDVPPTELWAMNADGSSPRQIAVSANDATDGQWGDIAWSGDDWIVFVVAQNTAPDGGMCFKTRMDKIRPDGSSRTQIDQGGPNCTPQGLQQSGDADPGVSADNQTLFTSRGLPEAPVGAPGQTVRKLYSLSSDAWYSGKAETDLSLASEPSCIEGHPKGSPDGARVSLYRQCFYTPNEPGGIFVTDTAGSYRTLVYGDGFCADWNPAFGK
jgi:dipeptidyl aminopeptidase/acylaminoacyl peptidase